MSSDGDIIGMAEMIAIFGVTDDYGVDREQISVPLEIVVPLTVPIEEFADSLKGRLEALGYTLVDEE